MVQKSKNFLLFLSVAAMTQCGWIVDALAQVNNTGGGGGGRPETTDACGADTMGGIINCLREGTADNLIAVMEGGAYALGLLFGVTGIIKLKNHVESPNNVPLSDSMKRFAAGGALFALGYLREIFENTITNNEASGYGDTGMNGDVGDGLGLDGMLIAMMQDIFAPLQLIFASFGYVAGIMLMLIGISRLLKSEQEGPRGPAGIGTIMTFLMAACLFSLNTLSSHLTETMFLDGTFKTNGTLQYADGLGDTVGHVHAVISSIIAFGIIIGWVSIIRGIFIIRGVSEGSGNASMMAAITHLIGGVLALNLGSVVMAVQNTLGITNYGIIFQ